MELPGGISSAKVQTLGSPLRGGHFASGLEDVGHRGDTIFVNLIRHGEQIHGMAVADNKRYSGRGVGCDMAKIAFLKKSWMKDHSEIPDARRVPLHAVTDDGRLLRATA